MILKRILAMSVIIPIMVVSIFPLMIVALVAECFKIKEKGFVNRSADGIIDRIISPILIWGGFLD